MGPLSPTMRRALLEERLAEKEAAITEAVEDIEAGGGGGEGGVSVMVGTSTLAAEHPGLADRLTEMVHRAYGAVRGEGPRMLRQQPIQQRLAMGDLGTRANRVLHVAFLGGEVVGCVSTSFATLWTESGVGHWGLLCVEPSVQGTGVATVLLNAAERRLAEECDHIHIEYDFFPADDFFRRLRAWYERRGYVRLGARPKEGGPEGSEFCFCRRPLSEAERRQGRQRRLRAERAELVAELAELGSACCAAHHAMRSRGLFDALSAFVQSNGAMIVQMVGSVFQFDVIDAGHHGKFVLDLKHGAGSAKPGEDHKADCTIVMTDADLDGLVHKKLDGQYLFWCGRLKVRGDGQQFQKLFPLFDAALAASAK
mmetsp:Transcript_81048/g.224226  ORF Transcript_81048/g.224226 Transcript_81048/m.224226 type:complete len:368 (-) Transcript_81048:20-1123(-)